MCNFSHYLIQQFAVVVDNKRIAHVNAHDFALLANTPQTPATENSLNALHANNHVIVIRMKSKFISFGLNPIVSSPFIARKLRKLGTQYGGNMIKVVQEPFIVIYLVKTITSSVTKSKKTHQQYRCHTLPATNCHFYTYISRLLLFIIICYQQLSILLCARL